MKEKAKNYKRNDKIMYENIKGKKLLILAGEPNLISLVERAKELGVYTIVTDYYDISDSPAKLVADEYWNISWSDLDALEEKCKEVGINGITTGYSESPVECCIKLCERLNLPCYCNLYQLEVTRNKVLFKEECRKNGVPVVNEYKTLDEVNSFPVIIKPVDRAGSIGISIANNKDELLKAYDYAMEKSYCKKVIIEDFISDGTKFDVMYAILDGKIIFLTNCDTINAKNNGLERVVQSGWIWPSKYHNFFEKKADKPIRKMIKNLGIKNGYIFFSGFSLKKENDVDFVFFETGFRLSGGHMDNYMKKCNYINYLDIFIIHALTGNTKQINVPKKHDKDLKYIILNYYASKGKISKYEGIEKIKKMKDFCYYVNFSKIGQICDEEHAILSKLCMIHFCNSDSLILAEDVKKCNNLYCVKDENNHDMVYDRMNSSIIANWWK